MCQHLWSDSLSFAGDITALHLYHSSVCQSSPPLTFSQPPCHASFEPSLSSLLSVSTPPKAELHCVSVLAMVSCAARQTTIVMSIADIVIIFGMFPRLFGHSYTCKPALIETLPPGTSSFYTRWWTCFHLKQACGSQPSCPQPSSEHSKKESSMWVCTNTVLWNVDVSTIRRTLICPIQVYSES